MFSIHIIQEKNKHKRACVQVENSLSLSKYMYRYTPTIYPSPTSKRTVLLHMTDSSVLQLPLQLPYLNSWEYL